MVHCIIIRWTSISISSKLTKKKIEREDKNFAIIENKNCPTKTNFFLFDEWKRIFSFEICVMHSTHGDVGCRPYICNVIKLMIIVRSLLAQLALNSIQIAINAYAAHTHTLYSCFFLATFYLFLLVLRTTNVRSVCKFYISRFCCCCFFYCVSINANMYNDCGEHVDFWPS